MDISISQKTNHLKHTMSNFIPFLKCYKWPLIIISLIVMILIPIGVQAKDLDSATYKIFCNEIESICNVASSDSIKNMVNISFSGDELTVGGMTVSTSIVKTMNDLAKSAAMIFVVVTCCLNFLNLKEFVTDQTTAIRILFALVVGVFFINNAQTMCMWLTNIGSQIVGQLSGGDSSVAMQNSIAAIEKQVHDESQVGTDGAGIIDSFLEMIKSITGPLPYVIQLFLPWLISRLVYVAIYMTCWARAIEIVVLTALSPIAFSDVVAGPVQNSSALRFAKNFAALALSGAIILAVVMISSSIMAGAVSDSISDTSKMFDAAMTMVGISLAEASMVVKAQSVARTLCGVG